ncbi:mannosyl-oligosaccharide alpha-1,2-mannosidase [Dissophora globulifera]|nr:mannosyl-oligosaccharide alpha-1,2-mannosidase [Dissophora globulifera]
MYRRDERSGIPLHDDNKYAKQPIAVQAKTRIRLRKRHAVLILCLVAATCLFLKSPSTSVSWSSTHPSESKSQVQVGKNLAPPPPPPVPVPVPEAGPVVGSVEEPIKPVEKKKKKKKKAPLSLFDFESNDKAKGKKGGNSSDKSGSRSKDSKKKQQDRPSRPITPPRPSPPPPAPVAPVVKQQHNWKESEDLSSGSLNDRVVGGAGSSIDQDLLDADDHDVPDEDVIGTNGSSGSEIPTSESQKPRPKVNPPLWEERKNKVKQAFLHSWNAYRRDAWGKDEYHPISKYGSNLIRKGQGFTIVDSLDTILLMGLEEEFQTAKAWVRDELDFDQDGEVNLFETTIRVLGGLLSAYDQSNHDPVFLDKAVDLADRLMGAFETASGIPYASVHLGERRGVPSHDRGISSTSEAATLQLEFKYLSYLTGDDKYWKAAENVVLKIRESDNLDGLVPIYINPYTGNFQGGEIRLGSRGDSYYEYLIKQYLQTGKQEQVYKDMYDHAIGGIKKHLLGRSIPRNLLFVGEISKYEPSNLSPKMDHLVCFLGGTMALASTSGQPLDDATFPRSSFSAVEEDNFKIGEELTESCYEMYHQTETGLAPEIVYWVQKQEQTLGKTVLQHTPGSDFIINDRDGHNWLRPETLESLFYLWRLTGDEKYRNWGWNIFEAFEKYSKVASGGYSSIHDIRRANKINFSDKMETFFLAETLKYFYLLFGSDDVLPLDKYVFNTEAHPLPIFTPPERFLERTRGLLKMPPNNGKVTDEDLNSQEEDIESFPGSDDDEQAPSVDENVLMDEVEDEIVGTDDSLLNENYPNMDDEDPSRDTESPERDEVDQGLEDLSVDAEDEESEEVPEVEVDYEENSFEADRDSEADGDADQEQEEEEEEDGEGDGEEAEEAEEGEEGEEAEEEEAEEEEQGEEEQVIRYNGQEEVPGEADENQDERDLL